MVLFLAARNLVRSRSRTLLLWLGISVSGALLYDMVMLAGGLEASFSTVLRQMNLDLRLTPRGTLPFSGEVALRHATPLLEAVRSDPRVAEARGIYGTTLYVRRAGGPRWAAFAMGVTDGVPEVFQVRAGGSLVGPSARNEAWVNRRLAEQLGARLGDVLEVTGPPGTQVSWGGASEDLRVGAIGEFRFDTARQRTLLLPLSVARRLRGTAQDEPLSLVVVRLKHPADAPAVAADFRARFPQAEVYQTRDLLEKVRGQLSYFTQFSAVLGSMSFLVAWLLISTLLVLSLNDRVGEFAVLRAVGLKGTRLVRLLLVESLAFVALSVPSALILGLVTARRLDALLLAGPGLPTDLHFFVATPLATLQTAGLLFLAGALGALYPMIRVAGLPIAATLHEAAT